MNIKFLHYNIAACRNYETADVVVKEARTLEAIRAFNADIITLNEVDCEAERSGKVNQPRFLADALGYNYYFAPAIELGGGHYGIALLTKYKIVSAEFIRIPDCYNEKGILFERRVIISAVLDVEGTKLRVMMSHYGLTRQEQVNAVEYTLAELAKSDLPTVFSGDLNMTPDNPLVRKLSEHMQDSVTLFEKTPMTFPSFKTVDKSEHANEEHNEDRIKIDYIFTHGAVKAEKADVPDIRVSDHRPYYCELSL